MSPVDWSSPEVKTFSAWYEASNITELESQYTRQGRYLHAFLAGWAGRGLYEQGALDLDDVQATIDK